MKTFRCSDANRHCLIFFTLLALLMLPSTSPASRLQHIWQSSDQFVALELQDSVSSGTVPPNDHPVKLTLDRITSILTAIEISSADNGKPEQLFTRTAVQTLAPQLLQGLQQASSKEDITFAVIGLHDALYGLAKSPKVTTGRVFYQGGRLNIIFGLVRQEVRDRDDRRLFPFTPGGRQKAAAGEWHLLPQPGQIGYSLLRKDWLAVSDDWQAPVLEMKVPSKQTKPAERLTTLKELQEKGLISEEEYRSKRQEILNGL